MNILLTNDYNLDHGGVSVFLLQWIIAIKSLNTNTEVYVYFRGKNTDAYMENQYTKAGAKIFYGDIPVTVGFKNTSMRKRVKQDVQEIIRERKIDVVHVNSSVLGFTAIVLNEAKREGVKTRVTHVHGRCDEQLIDKITHHFLRRQILQRSTVIAACSRNAVRYLFGNDRFDNSDWRFVPNTIVTERFRFDFSTRSRIRKELEICEEEVLLGAVGRLSSEKNQGFLIDIMTKLKEIDSSFKLLILGDGPDRAKIEAYIESCGVKQSVILPGAVDDVSEWLSAMDYYLMPSFTEGLPISALEAQANGLFCLLSDRVSDEVDLTENVIHLSIDYGVDEWIRVLKRKEMIPLTKREYAVNDIKKAGFDEHDAPRYVKELYDIGGMKENERK